MKTPHKRDVLKPSSSTSCSKHVQHATQLRFFGGLSSWNLENSRAGDYTRSWGKQLQFLIILSNFFLVSTWNLPRHNLRPFSLVLEPCTSVKSLSLSSQQLPCRSWKTTGRSSQSHLFSRLYKASSLSFSSQGTCSCPRPSWGPSNGHTHVCQCFFLYWRAQN